MTDLTLTQRILRIPINFLVEHYFPNGFFFGNGFCSVFEEAAKGEGVVNSAPKAAAAFLLNYLSQRYSDEVKFEITDVTLRGEPVGRWSITISRETEQQND